MRVKKSIYIVLAVIISGCIKSPSYVDYENAPKPILTDNSAIVYIYRSSKGKPYTYGSLNIDINNDNTVNLSYNEYTWVTLKPGQYTFKAYWPPLEKPLFEGSNFDEKSFELIVLPGQSYFINYEITQDRKPTTILETQGGLVGKAISGTHILNVNFDIVSEKIGKKIINGCWYKESRWKYN